MIKKIVESLFDRLGVLSLATYIYQVYLKRPPLAPFKELTRYYNYQSQEKIPIPSMYLRWLVINQIDPMLFLESGRLQAEQLIKPLLEKHHAPINTLGSILDFGCGCGRIIRYWHDCTNTEIWGCDYNPRLVKWCQKNIGFAQFKVNELQPPLPFEQGKFEFVYARSVFTHLTEKQQIPWLEEVHRVLQPRGLFLITVSGAYRRESLSTEEQQLFDAGKMVLRNSKMAGRNTCTAYHPQSYVMEILARSDFNVLEFVPGGTVQSAWQDTYLARRN